MKNFETQYLDLLEHLLESGNVKEDRTGTGTKSVFGYQIRHDLSKGFPLLTTKSVHFKSVAHELLWFLRGDTNIAYLKENGVSIWDEWADEKGELSAVYGAQWRTWKGKVNEIVLGQTVLINHECIDQIAQVIDQIKSNPNSRRLLVNAWNVADLPNMALPPCHYSFQFYVHEGKLSCLFNMRSTDVFLGLPFNMASYALLTHMVAQVCGLEVGELVFSGADVHLYLNHFEQVNEQLAREPRALPTIRLNPDVKDIFEFRYDDFALENYNPHPAIKAPVAV